jgi:transcriptional regulator with PAS, ATPase and Fis domain
MQTRLLRVLQERAYEPLGSVESIKANVRLITATNKSLSQLVGEGKFREDLFYRIHVVRLELPSLRDRREDIPLLIEHFVAAFNRRQGKDIVGVSDEVLGRLMDYDFPGNVRELENIIEHAFVLCRSGLIKLPHLPPELRPVTPIDQLKRVKGMTLQSVEVMMIRDALRRNQGNKTKAAQELGIDASTLFRKIKTWKPEPSAQIEDGPELS